jgi:uncharacterized metal-binding protein YceD (DUF177 family)
MSNIPLERFHDLSNLPDAGYETSIVASPEELLRLAEWLGVEEVTRLQGRVTVHPQAKTRFLLECDYEADIVQRCVVTLEPVRNHIAQSFTRELHFTPGLHRFADKGGMVPSAAVDDDGPEEIESTRYDLAAPLLEEFSLAIDPYPRAPGVAFESGSDDDQTESPFAVLEKLKRVR